MKWETNAGAPRYQRLRVAIGDSSPSAAVAIKDAMHDRGVEEVILCNSTDRLFRALDNEIVDLLIWDYHISGDDFVRAMQSIRRKEIGLNPFITIVATIRESDAETVRRLIDAGVDDLIRSPVSIDRLFESIDKSARRRRPFVVTYEDVGPTRPVAKREKKIAVTGIRVPNTLKSRAIDNASEDEIRRLVESAVQNMVTRQLEACGVEIDNLARLVASTHRDLIDPKTATREDNTTMRGALSQIGVAADSLCHTANGTPSAQVSGLAATLIPIAQRILDAPSGRAAIEVQLLSQLATAVRRALSVEPNSSPAMREIASTVSDFARRASADSRVTAS